jgi:HTH-type transcriptional regulator, sugar sensing transcriptional regulator
MIPSELEQALKEFGLTPGEAKVYLTLLQLGESHVGKIIKDSGISRSKVYDILERLKQKGVVSKVDRNNVASFQALPPRALFNILEKKESELKIKRELLEKSLPQFDKLHQKKSVELRIFEGFEGFKTVIDETVGDLKKEDCYEVMGISQTTEGMRYYARKIYEAEKKKGFSARSIFDERGKSKAQERKTKLHDIRVLPKGWETPALFTVYQDKVGIHMGDEEEIISISIKNPKIAKSFRANFQAMWNISKKL